MITVYPKQCGYHVHVQFFSNGVLNGKLVFSPEEWCDFRIALKEECFEIIDKTEIEDTVPEEYRIDDPPI